MAFGREAQAVVGAVHFLVLDALPSSDVTWHIENISKGNRPLEMRSTTCVFHLQ